MAIKAILFGSIGTIVETSNIQRNCFNSAFKNSGLMDDLMVHEVFDYNKAFKNAAHATKSVIKPAE